jgi:hypothetical protein
MGLITNHPATGTREKSKTEGNGRGSSALSIVRGCALLLGIGRDLDEDLDHDGDIGGGDKVDLMLPTLNAVGCFVKSTEGKGRGVYGACTRQGRLVGAKRPTTQHRGPYPRTRSLRSALFSSSQRKSTRHTGNTRF